MDTAELDAVLASFVGKPVGSGSPTVAPDPVNQPMIRHWAAAFGDGNPVYTDPEYAAKSRFGAIVAPPLMLQTWTFPTPQLVGIAERGGAPTESTGESPLAVLDRAGFVGTLASNSEYEIHRYLELGETLSVTTVFESISAEKTTRMGVGRFITWIATYVDDTGEPVAVQRFRIFKFRPLAAAPAAAKAGTRADAKADAAEADAPVAAEAEAEPTTAAPAPGDKIAVGAPLPELRIDVTATLVVAGAIATRDFMPVHHDRDYAQAHGSPDIFMNILSDTAYCSRYLTDWAGPEAAVKSLAIRLGVPSFPGSTLVFTGSVTGVEEAGDEYVVAVELRADNNLGPHVTGTATLTLPRT